MTTVPKIVALIPARSGSKRVRDKNVRLLAGHPLLAYTIAAARSSEVFQSIIVSTDSERYAAIARHYGAEVPYLRPAEFSGDRSPDIEWVSDLLQRLAADGRRFDYFSLLRPTSPFRLPSTIQRAWSAIQAEPDADSLRAIEKCKQHPGKMWVVRGRRMLPVMPFTVAGHPWHSSQYPSLPEIYVQNASLEIARCSAVLEGGSIAGDTVMPFITEGSEGLDVNGEEDWWYAEWLLSRGEAILPAVNVAGFE